MCSNLTVVKKISPQQKLIFYTINEWTSRKEIEKLVECFLQTFENTNDSVLLYIKSSGVEKTTGTFFIESRRKKYQNPPEIILCTDIVSESEMKRIHQRSHIYVSLSHGEGTGLGAVEAICYGNPVIITGYGGQIDYLKSGVFYVSSSEQTPSMCNKLQNGHKQCGNEDGCKLYPWYLPDQHWGNANVDDAKRVLRFVYDTCIRPVVYR